MLSPPANSQPQRLWPTPLNASPLSNSRCVLVRGHAQIAVRVARGNGYGGDFIGIFFLSVFLDGNGYPVFARRLGYVAQHPESAPRFRQLFHAADERTLVIFIPEHRHGFFAAVVLNDGVHLHGRAVVGIFIGFRQFHAEFERFVGAEAAFRGIIHRFRRPALCDEHARRNAARRSEPGRRRRRSGR